MAASDNDWCKEWQRMTTSDSDWYNEWQRMTASGTTNSAQLGKIYILRVITFIEQFKSRLQRFAQGFIQKIFVEKIYTGFYHKLKI